MQILVITILLATCVLAFFVRVFSVIKYESIIHEYDPWFNFRSTRYMEQQGMYEFWNWYDSESWFPLGRVVGGTSYPGLMFTGCFIKWGLAAIGFPEVDIREICVFMAPVFSGPNCIATYLLGVEATGRKTVGMLAALFIAVIPTLISRGVAGSYDNEATAIFAIIGTFYLWVKACHTGSTLWSLACVLCYFYLVASWGGYSFAINLIPLYVLGCIFIDRLDMRVFVAYNCFYTQGTMLSMLITYVQP